MLRRFARLLALAAAARVASGKSLEIYRNMSKRLRCFAGTDVGRPYGGRAETLPVGPGVAMSSRRTTRGVQRCKNDGKRRPA